MVPIQPSAAPNNTNLSALSPERQAEIVARLDDEDRTASELTDIVTELLAEMNRLRSETAGLRQGIERQEARTEHIAKQALRWKAEADGRKKYGAQLRAELAALSAKALDEVADFLAEVGESGAAYLLRTVDVTPTVTAEGGAS